MPKAVRDDIDHIEPGSSTVHLMLRNIVLTVVLALLFASSVLRAAEADHLAVQLNADDAQHLLARTGFGVAPGDMLALRGKTRQQAIDQLMAGFVQQPALPMPAWTQAPVPHYHARGDMDDNERARFNNERDVELAQLRQWWTLTMLQSDSVQTERMVLFWHDVFATSYYDTDRQSLAMARQNQTFRTHGMGSWKSLLEAMIRDAALLEFLDAGSNHKESPNENLARELLELFTLGENHFDEKTVKEAARSLTGHDTARLHNLEFRRKTWKQDRDDKVLFGETGPHTGDDLIRIILEQPAAADFMAVRFWHAFVSDEKADAQWVETMAHTFRSTDYQISSLYRAVLESDAFWHQRHRGMLIKSPMDLLVGTARSLEYPRHHWRTLVSAQASLGMELFAPPNVSGWKEGAAFVTPGRLLERYKVVDALLEEPGATSANTAAMMTDMKNDNASVALILAAEDYQGPVRYQVSLYDHKKRLWAGPGREFTQGHDTQRHGRINNLSELNWSTQLIAVPDELLSDVTRIAVTYLNDHAGPGGDRNFFVDGIQFDGRWYSGSDATQVSDCEPRLPANAWKLYCAGELNFNIQQPSNRVVDTLPAWRASAVHVQWANEDMHSNQTAYLTLDDVKTPERNYHAVQFSVVTRVSLPPQIRLESFGCWPDCIDSEPECVWSDPHFPANKTLAFSWLDTEKAASSDLSHCQLKDLSDQEKQLVSVLWASVPELLRRVKQTHRGARFTDVLETLERKMAQRKIALSATPYAIAQNVFEIDAAYAPIPAGRETLSVPAPVIDGPDALMEQLASVDLSFDQLLFPGIDVSGMLQVSTQGSAREQLKAIVQHPLFQVK